MTEIKYTDLLQKYDTAARAIPGVVSMFSAERFVLVILYDILNVTGDMTSPEYLNLLAMTTSRISDIAGTASRIEEYLKSGKGSSLSDSLYIKKAILDISKQSKNAGIDEISAVMLLTNIFSTPNASLPELIVQRQEEHYQAVEPKKQTSAEPEKQAESTESAEQEKLPAETVKEKIACLVSDVKRIRSELKSKVYGQDNAVNVFVTGYFQAMMLSMLDKSRRKPRATFLFAGPPGVGKTFLAETAAQTLGLPFKRFDMSEYCDKEAAIEFCGSDGVYRNSKSGNFTSYLSENPECVLLFDEIEKAHISIIHMFLQILDAGRIRDSKTDEELSLKDAILIFTTNAGKRLYSESDTEDLSTLSRKVVLKALQNDVNPQTGTPYFPGAICSRFASGNVVMFNHMGAHNLHAIAKREILRNANNLTAETGIKVKIDEKVYTAMLFAEGANADARTITSRASSFLNDELYELFRLINAKGVGSKICDIENVNICVDLNDTAKDVATLFEADEKTRILVYSDENTVSLCASKLSWANVSGVCDYASATEAIQKHGADFVMIDMLCGADERRRRILNIEDADSPARDFFKFLREKHSGIPIYVLVGRNGEFGEEETVSFLRQGVRGVLYPYKGNNAFSKQVKTLADSLHQQKGIKNLASANKLVTFETSQSISKNGKTATIILFDFRSVLAIDSEDSGSILGSASKPNKTFDDVIGAEAAKDELRYFAEYLRDPRKFADTGVNAPRGVLLYGPPGTGKTMLAKAMACESNATFITAEGNQFLKKYVGEGPEKVHELFRTARKYAPSILFIDEIDAIAKERGGANETAASAEEVLTSFLTEMDGFRNDPSKPVFVLAATNYDVKPGHERSLDPALMRRFDRRVYIDLPTKDERIKFLKKRLAETQTIDVSQEKLENIAVRSTGMSLAELDSVVELALRTAIRQFCSTVTDEIFEEAFETFNNGEVKKWDASQLERVARHEAGHAFLCWQSGETPSYLTVVARADHGGYMQHSAREGKAIYTKDELLARIRTSLGGRAAEIVYYGERDGISTGAAGDLQNATAIAKHFICSYGMDSGFGLAVLDPSENPAELRAAVNSILDSEMKNAVSLIREHKKSIDALVEVLITQNHMTGIEINALLSGID